MSKQTVIAICYDFDKTLSPKDMQEYGVIPVLKIKPKKFWKESNKNAVDNKMDRILSYMELIIQKANAQDNTFKESDFNSLGKNVELFPGVDSWFERINKYANDRNILIEHYIISAGLKEIIEGTSIAKYFKEIYASCFLYDGYQKPKWPRQVVNYTQKTQYLFRISKHSLDLSDEETINNEYHDRERRIPFKNMIYIGDSDTDIPAMKVLKNYGGVSIGVYNPFAKQIKKVSQLILDGRIDFFAPADYTENSILDKYIKRQIDRINISNQISIVNQNQTDLIRSMNFPFSVLSLYESDIKFSVELEELNNIRKNYSRFINRWKKEARKNDNEYIIIEDIFQYINDEKNKLDLLVKKMQDKIKKESKLINQK